MIDQRAQVGLDGTLNFTLYTQVKYFGPDDIKGQMEEGLYLQYWLNDGNKTVLGPVPQDMMEDVRASIIKHYSDSISRITNAMHIYAGVNKHE